MPAYPSHNILMPSLPVEESGIVDDFAESGPMHSRVFHSQSYYRFTIYHQLSRAQWIAYRAAYQADKRSAWTGLTFYNESPARTYTVYYTAPPQVVQNLGGGRVLIEVQLRGTAD